MNPHTAAREATIAQTAKDFLELESEFGRFSDFSGNEDWKEKEAVGRVHDLLGNLLCWITDYDPDSMTVEWLDKRKAEINHTIGVAQSAVGITHFLWDRLGRTRSLALRLVRLLHEKALEQTIPRTKIDGSENNSRVPSPQLMTASEKKTRRADRVRELCTQHALKGQWAKLRDMANEDPAILELELPAITDDGVAAMINQRKRRNPRRKTASKIRRQ